MYNTSDIFTPSSPARETFVERYSLNSLLVDSLHTKGKQIIIYGHSGTGKTTLLYNKLNQTYEGYIFSKCTSDMTFNQLVLNAFDDLGKFVVVSSSASSDKKIGFNLTGGYGFIKGTITQEYSTKDSKELRPIVPPQLTPQKLASFFGASNLCWVIDDFRKMPDNEKRHLAQWMKVFMDESVNYPNVKIIAIGAVGKAKELIDLDNELKNRVSEIFVPFMNEDELRQIMSIGETKLNIHFDEDVKLKIIKLSSGLPSVTHQLCLNLCFSKGLYKTSETFFTFDLEDFKSALLNYVLLNSGYLQNKYEKATREEKNNTIPIYYHIIRAFLLKKKHHLSLLEISKYFKDHLHPQSEALLKYLLNSLTTEKRGKVLEYEEDSDTWFIPDPFFRVYCICVMDLSRTTIQAQYDLFNTQNIEKSKNKSKEQEKELVRLALDSGVVFDF